ncbi:CtsR family transcriptional regulator, partial [Pediococcus acidilactici]|nr:CtsR family transcriptional regulator [Pediococcus acidilactici]
MQGQNISDIIERYLKEILADSEEVEIRRSEIADQFDVVPSQINYVIKTRFTIQNGYLVESKRGGGGYIRIEKVKLLDDIDVLDSLIRVIGDSINERDAISILSSLYEDAV